MIKTKKKHYVYIFTIILILVFFISFGIGRYPVNVVQLLKVLSSKIFPIDKDWPDTINTIVFQVRLPRIIGAMLVGTSLSLSGAVYQGMFKNPLVSPDILGVSSGAAFGAALAYIYLLILGDTDNFIIFGLVQLD